MRDILIEMQALIAFCEVTDCKATRTTVKSRLMVLSQIPKNNPWSYENIDFTENHCSNEIVKDYTSKFTPNQIEVIKFYLQNPDYTLEKICIKFNNPSLNFHFISRYFALSPQERELITKS